MPSSHAASVLHAVRLPARLTAEQTAELLGFQVHDIPILVSSGFLKPLGSPAQNSTKYFAAAEVENRAKDLAWLAKTTREVGKRWAEKNGSRKKTLAGLAHE